MALSSYADMTVGAVFFNLRSTEDQAMKNHLRGVARESRVDGEVKRRYVADVIHYLESYHFSLLAHEWCHILQALTYPALYLRCLRELDLCRALMLGAQKIEGDITLPLHLPSDWQETLYAPTLLYRLTIDQNNKVSLAAGASADRRPNDLSEVDLMEEDACIFQYKIEIDGEELEPATPAGSVSADATQ